MTTQNFLFIFLSLYTIQSCGMENNAAIKPAHQRKHADNRQKRKFNTSSITFIKYKNMVLNSEEKEDIQTSLKQNIQTLDECYSAGETWSEDDLEARNDGKQLIELLKK